jgi:hypothetical protein
VRNLGVWSTPQSRMLMISDMYNPTDFGQWHRW